MLKEIKEALLLFLVLVVITGVIYPLVVNGVAHVVFPVQANGSLIEKNGKIIGSSLIGQKFNKPGFFHSRPSCAGAGYDATKSGASNLSPTNAKLQSDIATRFDELSTFYSDKQVPSDLLLSSASGLDPHISPKAAMYQVPKIAKINYLKEVDVTNLVEKNTERPLWGVFGGARVNVLKLNIDLQNLVVSNQEQQDKNKKQGKAR